MIKFRISRFVVLSWPPNLPIVLCKNEIWVSSDSVKHRFCDVSLKLMQCFPFKSFP